MTEKKYALSSGTIIFILISLPVFWYLLFSEKDNKPEKFREAVKPPYESTHTVVPKINTPEDNAITAFIAAQKIIERTLKAPATADFVSYTDSSVTFTSPDTYIISSYVDAQNGFGAQIRTRYVMTVKNNENDNWSMIDLKTEP